METLEKVPTESAFGISTFDHAQRVAKMLSSSSLIPKEYQGNIQNTMIALEMANRIGASPLMVMQNLYIVHGKPSWSSSFIIAALNSSKKFSPVRFEMSGDGEEYGCFAWAYDADNKEKLAGPKITMKMAKLEGWIDKNGSKWKTMPELMLRYRAAAFFGRLYAPEIMMGMQTMEEVIDINASVIEDISVEQLQALYDEKLHLLTKSEMDNAKRIIDNLETASYKKLHTLLTSKTDDSDKQQ
jgi:hypothetical protein